MPEGRRRVGLARLALPCMLLVFGRGAWAQESGAREGGSGAGGNTGSGASSGVESSGPIGASPSVLPATGVGAAGPDVRVGNLGGQLAGLSGQPLAPGGERAWTLTPSIGLSEEYITGSSGGAGSGSGGATNQFITTITPSIVVSGDTTRLHGDLAYAPSIELYSRDGSQNQIAQNFNGRLLATLLPQTLFLDLRGSASVQSVTQGVAPNDTTNLSRGNSSQTTSFSASPYAVHRFGPWGTGEVGATIARTTQNALAPASQQTVLQNLAAEASNQNVTSYGGHLAFVTGEEFSRYSGTALGQATRFDGTGVLRGAYRDTATLDNGYAITRTITALATIGWERIHYAGTSPVDINDAVWNVGIRLEPNPESSITVRYGHQDGLNSVLVDAGYQPTPRTRIYARYSTGLTTQAEQLQNALATSDLDALGNPVDHTTGAPLVAAGNFFGTQNSLFKTTIASLTGVLLLDRDTISIGVNSQTQELISASNAVGLASGNNKGVYGSVSWSHELRPNLQSTLFAQYGTTTTEGVFASTQTLFAASASLSYALTKTLSGQVQYSYSQTFGGNEIVGGNPFLGGASGGGQSLVLVSLIKSF